MATVHTLVAQGDLVRIDPALGPMVMENRLIYALPRVITWFENVLSDLGSTWNLEESPAEQADALIAQFCEGEPLHFGQRFNCLRPAERGVWELKTADLRFFGWFLKKDVFIVSDCDHAERVKTSNMYAGYREQAVRFREQLDLDEPKFIDGETPNDVISDFIIT